MATWDSDQYLKFNDERTRPCRDLAAGVQVSRCNTVIDLGCGPGNSTAVLRERWPAAKITGIDSSPEMIAAAKASGTEAAFAIGDISAWQDEGATGGGATYDLIFSNAAFQWVPEQVDVLRRCLARVAAGGALAIQVPCNLDSLPHRLMRDLSEGAFRRRFVSPVHRWHAQPLNDYYDALSPHAAAIDCWTTTYQHVLPDADAIVEFYKGTALRPYLSALVDDAAREDFLNAFTADIRNGYATRADGRVLFPFDRLFLIAYVK